MFEFDFYNPVRVTFGAGKVALAGEKAAELGSSALLVSYSRLGPLAPVLEAVEASLAENGLDVVAFCQFEENPAIETVAAGVALAREAGCDVVVAVGGGSAMDGAKAIAAGVYYDGDLWNMVYHRHDGSDASIAPPEKALPLLAIPTLPATGSEMNMCSVVTSKARQEKSYIWAECLFPRVAILDPELTTSLPPQQTACAAADAISHVLEIYINSQDGTPLQHSFQEGCMRTTIENVTIALEDPENIDARGNLMWAATCAINGWSWPGDGWTPMHQVGHVLTTRFGINHGSSLTVIMPHWMRYNAKRRPGPYLRFAKRVMAVATAGKSDEAIIAEGIDRFEAFLRQIGVPTSLADVRIPAEEIPKIIDGVAKVSFGADGNLACNPVMSREDIEQVLAASAGQAAGAC